MLDTLKRYVPAVRLFDNYDRQMLSGDLTAGVTTAVMLIPQAMAYAMLAGLPPIIGLYASIVPVAVYALFGSSRDLAVGPVAMVSLLVAAGVGGIAGGVEEYVALAVLLALMVGVIQLIMGIGRLGFLVNFLSHPVISGFTSAAALIIGFSQLKHLMGLDIARSHHVHEIIGAAAAQLGNIEPITLGIGLASVVVLLLLKKFKPMFPRALAVVGLATIAVWAFDLNAAGVAIVGTVPAGFPAPGVPGLDWGAIGDLLPIALTISLVGFMESISVAKAYASRKRYDVDANQELIGLGLANIAGSFFRAYPVTGGFSRTAVNSSAGANSPIAGLVTAGIVGVALLFFTPLFYFIPNAVLAAIIMTAVFGLIDVKEVSHLWKVKPSDLALLGLTFAATLSLGIEEGILTGVGASLLWFVVRTTRPHIARLGRLPGTTSYRNVKNHPDALTFPGILIVRMDAQFYFGNISFLKEKLSELEAAEDTEVHTVIIDASAMNQLDSSAEEALRSIERDYRERGVDLSLAYVKGPVREVMERSALWEDLGEDRVFLTVDEAVETALEHHPVEPRRVRESRADDHPGDLPSRLHLETA